MRARGGQPTIYRSIISEVIEAVRTDFDEVGVEEAVLQELLRSWEDKVARSRVADFANDPRIGQEARKHPPLPTQQAVNVAHAASSNVRPLPCCGREFGSCGKCWGVDGVRRRLMTGVLAGRVVGQGQEGQLGQAQSR